MRDPKERAKAGALGHTATAVVTATTMVAGVGKLPCATLSQHPPVARTRCVPSATQGATTAKLAVKPREKASGRARHLAMATPPMATTVERATSCLERAKDADPTTQLPRARRVQLVDTGTDLAEEGARDRHVRASTRMACLLYMAGILFLLQGLVFAVVAALSWYSQGDLKQLSIMLFDTAVEDYFSAKNTRRRNKVAIMVAQ